MRIMKIQTACAHALMASLALAETIITKNQALSNCPPLGPVLPAPKAPSKNADVQAVLSQIKAGEGLIAELLQNATGMSVTVSSAHEDEPLLSIGYTPPVRNMSGTDTVDGDTVFRIASVSKAVTVLGLLMLGEKVNMADPITKYVPELAKLKAQQEQPNTVVNTIDWDAVTLDALASQLAGIGNDLAYDLAGNPQLDSVEFGLPKLNRSEYAGCGSVASSRPCTWEDFWDNYGKRSPTYLPYATPAYSNVAYGLLGLVIERVSNEKLEDYIQHKILTPLHMTNTFLTKPTNDKIGFFTNGNSWWSTDLGFAAATGGMYSSSNDLVKLGKAILGHTLLPQAVTDAWLKPKSFTSSLGMAVGAPWEIARANNLTEDGRVIDLYTKSGGLGNYNSILVLIPDYDLVVAVQSAGEQSSVQNQLVVLTAIMPSLVRAIEAAGREEARQRYAGTYTDKCTNSTLTLAVDDQAGLKVARWVMNGKDIMAAYPKLAALAYSSGQPPSYLSIRMYPTGLETASESAWRAVFSTTDPADVEAADQLLVLQATCQSWNSIDNLLYGLRGLDAFTFGLDGKTGSATSVTPTAFRKSLRRKA